MIGKTSQTIHRNLFLPMQDPALFGDIAKLIHYTPGAPTASSWAASCTSSAPTTPSPNRRSEA
jgi:hypothetical protein